MWICLNPNTVKGQCHSDHGPSIAPISEMKGDLNASRNPGQAPRKQTPGNQALDRSFGIGAGARPKRHLRTTGWSQEMNFQVRDAASS